MSEICPMINDPQYEIMEEPRCRNTGERIVNTQSAMRHEPVTKMWRMSERIEEDREEDLCGEHRPRDSLYRKKGLHDVVWTT